jgi:hypothetical protein
MPDPEHPAGKHDPVDFAAIVVDASGREHLPERDGAVPLDQRTPVLRGPNPPLG